MKFLAKANKGVILFALVFAALVVYLAVLSASRAGDQPALKAGCEKYVGFAQQYSMLPQDYRSGDTLMTAAQQEQYTAGIKTALTPLFDGGSAAALNITGDTFRQNLQPLFAGQTVVSSNKIAITQYQDFTYSGDLISVTFQYTVNSNVSVKSAQGAVSPSSGPGRNNTGVITFKKAGGDFKIVSVNVFNAVNGGQGDFAG